MGRDDRNRLAEFRDGLDFRDRLGPDQTQRQLVQVYNGGAIPTSVPRVFLTHPAAFDAADTEGASYTATVDNSVSIPVVVLGTKIPVVGDLLIAHAVGGRWVAGDSAGGSTACGPVCVFLLTSTGAGGLCGLCQEDVLVVTAGPFSWPMLWNGSVWTTGNITVPYPGYPDQTGQITFSPYDPNVGKSAASTSWLPSGVHDTSAGHDWSCGPLHFHAVVLAGALLSFDDVLHSNGVTDLYIDDPNASVPASCNVIATITGCNGLPLPGASVSVVTGGTTVASGTTDSAGQFSYAASSFGAPGNTAYDLVVSKSRFTTRTVSFDLISNGFTVSVALNFVTGTRCVPGCVNPVATPLHATHPVFGALTLALNNAGSLGAGWYATVSYSYPGCRCCAAKTVTVTCFLNLSLVYSEHWKTL